jgi:deazaflavin-dependent oxidoreductase (nitroreductase family)
LLTTTGRRSGKKQTTPVSPIEIGNDLYLVSPYGGVGWVHNARASGEAWLQRGTDRKHVRLVEVSPEEAAPIIKAYLQREPFARKYASLDPDAPVEDFGPGPVSTPSSESRTLDLSFGQPEARTGSVVGPGEPPSGSTVTAAPEKSSTSSSLSRTARPSSTSKVPALTGGSSPSRNHS